MSSDAHLDLEKARRLQIELSRKVILHDCFSDPVTQIAGVDTAYTDGYSASAVSVFDYHSMRPVKEETSVQRTRFPYLPTLLFLRELPASIAVMNKIHSKPDVLLVNGQGYAHPRRFGLASHLGLVLDSPTIGIAKSALLGQIAGSEDSRWKPMAHKGEIIGAAVFTKPGCKPVYVSVGHKVSLETAVKIVLHCVRKYRVPEPLREAHLIAEKTKRNIAHDISHKAQYENR